MVAIGVIFNPRANKARRGKLKPATLESILGRHGIVKITENKEDSLRAALGEFLSNEIAIICSCGGDGTAHYVINEMLTLYESKKAALPVFLALPAGTINNMARNSTVILSKLTPEKSLELIVSAYGDVKREAIGSNPLPLMALEHNNKVDQCLVWSAGASTRFLERYYDPSTGETSRLKAVGLVARSFCSYFVNGDLANQLFTPIEGRLMIDWQEQHGSEIVLASSIPIKIMFYKPFDWLKGAGFGLYAVWGSFDRATIVSFVTRIPFGKPIAGSNVHVARVSQIELAAEEPVSYTVDGELSTARSMKLSKGKELRVVAL